MAENITKELNGDVTGFLEALEHDTRRTDAIQINNLIQRISGFPAKMWGTTMIGFGRYHYKYASGREGDYFRVGFSPRKQNLVVYIMPGYRDYSEILQRLGKHKTGKSCLYINKLTDIDLDVLEELICAGLADMAEKYPE